MNGKSGYGLIVWLLIVLFCELFLMAVMLPINVLQKAGQQERAMTETYLGVETADRLRTKTDAVYDSAFNKTGIMRESFNLFIPTKEKQANSKGLEKMGKGMFAYMETRLSAFWTAVYLGVHRMLALLMWIPAFIPFLVAAAYDALAIRKVRMLSFVTSSATVYGTSKTMLGATFFGPFIYALFPFSIPPMIAPIWCATVVLAIGGILVNWPRN